MKQPELGNKVTELRQLKQLTQEQLAEQCEVSTRTIQRIEKGEADPRTYTVTRLGEVLDYDFSAEPPVHETLWLTILHLSSMLCIVIIPLLLWSWKKGDSSRIEKEGRQVLNFQITMTICLVGALLILLIAPVLLVFLNESGSNLTGGSSKMLMVLLLPLPLVLIGLFCTYQGVVNAVRSGSGKPVHYALSIPFVK